VTLREYIDLRYMKGFWLTLVVAIPSILVAFTAPKTSWRELIGTVGFLGSILNLHRLDGADTLSPCHKPLGMVAQNRKPFAQRIMGNDRCPNCGLRLDEEIGTRT
jgi:hypothetical protein